MFAEDDQAEPLTIAYVAIGVMAAIMEAEPDKIERLQDAMDGQLGIVAAVIAHAPMLDRLAAAFKNELSGVFVYEVAEEFGNKYTTAMLNDETPSASKLALQLMSAVVD